MAVAAIIYGAKSGITRRIVHCDTMAELARGRHYGDGESIVILDPAKIMAEGLPDLDRCKALVAEARGLPAEDDRCIVIDNKTGDIVEVRMADPSLDVLPDGLTLFQDAKAEPGWALDAQGEYAAPVVAEAIADGAIEAAPAAKDGG